MYATLKWGMPTVVALFALGLVPGGELPKANAQEPKPKSVTVEKTRDMRFGEILIIKEKSIEAYNTTGMNDLPAKLWDAMDLEAIKKEFGAKAVQKNGPKYWMMDTLTVTLGETKSFGGIEARWAATLDNVQLGKSDSGSEPYKVFNPKKTQKMVYAKGKPVYELVDPDGHSYVLQAHGPEFTLESLSKLGERLKNLPKRWQYRTRVLTEDLILDLTPDKAIAAVGDEFHQYYTRIPQAK